MNHNKQRVLITGASKGIGKSIAQTLIKQGYDVLGTSRNPDNIKYEDKVDGLKYLPLDLNDKKSIECLIGKIDNIDVLINNAGQSQIGPVEEVPIEKIRQVFETNVFGAIILTQCVIPKMRAKQKGMIINISSLAGRIGVPFGSTYVSTKHALEGFSKAIRAELNEFGIKVVTISPDDINTTIVQDAQYKKDSPYYESVEKVKKTRDKKMLNAPKPEIVSQMVLKILKIKNPRYSYIVGKNSMFSSFLIKFLPESFMEKIIWKISGL